MWIVMTSAAQMPQNCWGRYRNVALVKLDQRFTALDLRPAMISARARGVLRVRHLGHFHDGRTTRCACSQAVARAEALAVELNNAEPIAEAATLATWGGSA